MRIGVPAETREGETRVAATPETVRKFAARHEVRVQAGAGRAAGYRDRDFEAAGARLVQTAAEACDADLVLRVRAPRGAELAHLRQGSILIGLLEPYDAEGLAAIARTGVTGLAMEWLPRVSRAQPMDVLSSQANLAGYKAVILAAAEFGRIFPMFMTAAGTLKAARVLVLGAGVAGLQAIATARRLGAVVEATDVRPAVKEQVESLGAKFVDVPYLTDEEREIAQGVGGYARPMPESWMKRQAEAVHERALASDVVIATALIPGRRAPVLVRAHTVAAMRPGAVIVDLAAEQGGNVEGTEAGRTVLVDAVKLVGPVNLPASVPTDASALIARNYLNFASLLFDTAGELRLDRSDELIAGTLACENGELVRRP